MPVVEGHVYLFKIGPFLKIGFSGNVKQRAKQLSIVSPWVVEDVVSVPGTATDERRIHSLMERVRFRGEWYSGDTELAQVVTELARKASSARELARQLEARCSCKLSLGAKRFHAWRSENRLSQTEAANLCGVTQSAIFEWERGTMPKVESVFRVQKVTGVNHLDWFEKGESA